MASSVVSNAIIFVQGSHASGAAVSAFLSKTNLSLEQLTFACATQPPTSTHHEAALLIPSPGSLTSSEVLSNIAGCMAPGSVIYVSAQDAAQAEATKQALLFGGFLNCSSQPAPLGQFLVQAHKPTWERGAKAGLTLKRPVGTESVAMSVEKSAAQAWKLSAEGDDDMVDEDELLTVADKQALPPVSAAASDCSTSKKACKNCSCGRAEAEAAGVKVKLTQEMLDNPQSNCGNCSLGDAFRCSGCPYRGLPAFEAGKKIVLGSDFLTADA